MKVYAWLIDWIHRRKNCPTGMISGWVQKVTEHRGTIQYITDEVQCVIFVDLENAYAADNCPITAVRASSFI